MITLPVSPSAPPAGLRLEGCTALVAEEEPVQALDLRRTLADLGCAVLGPVASGTEAVRLVRQRRPDLALLDLPLRDGGALRAAEALVLRQVPFALLTTGGELDLLGHPLLRAAPRLMKPYRSAELRRSVRELHRADLRARLDEAERRLAEGRGRLAHQLRLTRRLAAAGHEAALGRQLLRAASPARSG